MGYVGNPYQIVTSAEIADGSIVAADFDSSVAQAAAPFRNNNQIISENVTISATTNSSIVGTVTIGTGYTITVDSGGRLVVI